MNSNDIYTSILKGEVDADLDRITSAVRERRKMVGQMNAIMFKEGQRVKLFNLTPKTLNNQVGTIKAVPRGRGKQRFDIELDREIVLRHRLTSFVPGVPAECLVAVSEDAA